MDDDLFQFEPAPEKAPELVLGKKKKKKKKKTDDEAASNLVDTTLASEPHVGDSADHDDNLVEADLKTSKKKKKKKKNLLALDALEDENLTALPNVPSDDDANTTDVRDSNRAGKEYGGKGENDKTSSEEDSGNIAQPFSRLASVFSALDVGSDGDAHEEDHTIQTSKVKKKKKKKPLALNDIDSVSNAEPPEPEEDAVADFEPDRDMLNSGDSKSEVSSSHINRSVSTAEKAPKKIGRERANKNEKQKQEDDELAAILAELGDDDASQQGEPSVSASVSDDHTQPSGNLSAAQKKRQKKKKKNTVEEPAPVDDIEAILAELNEPEKANEASKSKSVSAPQDASPANDVDGLLAEFVDEPSAKSKKKKKKKKAGGVDDGTAVETSTRAPPDDVDALLADLGGLDVQPNSSKDKAEKDVPGGGDDVDDLLAELAADGDTSTTKKKAKKKKKKGGTKVDEVENGGGAVEVGESAPAQTEGKKKKKESAAVRKMREAREKMLAEEERLRKLKEEEEARILAEEKRKEEEARKKAEEKAKKKAAEKARRERKRQEGTLLSKAERERRRKAEIFKKQLMQQGMIPSAMKSDSQHQEEDSHNSKNQRKTEPTNPKDEEQKNETTTNNQADILTDARGKGDSLPIAGSITVSEAELKPSPPKEILDDWDAEDDEKQAVQDAQMSEKCQSGVGSRRDVERKKASSNSVEDEEESESDGDDNDSDETGSSDESDDSEYEGMSKAEIATEKRIEAIRKERTKLKQKVLASRTPDHLRSPVICILGHVDTGKTKILDKIRRTNVQDGEAGGITQQIGATYFPIEAVKKEATKLKEGRELSYNVPSLLIIDTPGHESFTNLRSRGSSLCDIAILVVDIMHGLEPQTRESIDLLKLRKTPFIVALNKIDRIYDWDPQPHNCPSRDALAKQPAHAREEFHRRVRETKLAFAEIGFNTELYWENKDVRKNVSLVPTSAITGEGIPDLLMLLLALPQRLLIDRLMFKSILEATVLEVKVIEGLGTTIDIILTGGTIHEGDTIVVVGLDGPIVATIRALLTPHPMKELRVKGQYLHHKEIKAAQGVKISADGLEKAVAGTQLMVVENPNNDDEVEYVRDEVMQDFQTILTNVDKSGLGVYVQASTLGSLEALLEFLRTSKIPVSGINIGPVHKKDVTKASTMLERRKEFATILAFDVIVEREAKELAEETGVKIFTADIIYHLFDQFTAYMEDVKKLRREQVNDDVVFPSVSRILPQHIYNKKDPIVVGVDVLEGLLRVGTPLVVKKKDTWLDIGRVASIELNKKQVVIAKKGESVAVKIQHKTTEHIMYGRHFDFQDVLVSKMSRTAIDLLKESFRDDLETEDWRLVVKLKKMFDIL